MCACTCACGVCCDDQGGRGGTGRRHRAKMDGLPNKKVKFKAAFTTFIEEYDRGLKSLQDDAKAVSLYTLSKV